MSPQTPNPGDEDPIERDEAASTTPPPPPPPPPRRLTRSRTDRILGGVGGGLAEHLGADPLLVRFGIALLVIVTGGTGLLLYAAGWLLIPDAPLAPDEQPPAPRSRLATITGVAALLVVVAILIPGGMFVGWFAVPFALLALAGLAVWWLVLGIPEDRSGRGVLLGIALGIAVLVVACLLFVAGAVGVAGDAGVVVAAIVLAAGLVLVVSAFVRPLRWLIIPALALGLGAGTAVAAGVEDVGGATGEEIHRPVSAADIRDRYELGAGHLILDLRNVDLQGEQRVEVDIGAGHAQVLVPRDVCVAADLHAGIGGLELFDRNTGGIDVDRVDAGRPPAGTPRLVVHGEVGLGYFEIDHEDDDDGWDKDWRREWRDDDDGSDDTGNACIGDAGARG